jgi:hypothetical protein
MHTGGQTGQCRLYNTERMSPKANVRYIMQRECRQKPNNVRYIMQRESRQKPNNVRYIMQIECRQKPNNVRHIMQNVAKSRSVYAI